MHAVLVPTRADRTPRTLDGVHVVGPEGVDRLLASSPLTPEAFLRRDAYAPLPSLVRAARDLFAREPLPRIKRARAATEPAVDRVTEIAHRAAAMSTRHLVLLTGVPGVAAHAVGAPGDDGPSHLRAPGADHPA